MKLRCLIIVLMVALVAVGAVSKGFSHSGTVVAAADNDSADEDGDSEFC